jgi:hypothetical protein
MLQWNLTIFPEKDTNCVGACSYLEHYIGQKHHVRRGLTTLDCPVAQHIVCVIPLKHADMDSTLGATQMRHSATPGWCVGRLSLCDIFPRLKKLLMKLQNNQVPLFVCGKDLLDRNNAGCQMHSAFARCSLL